MKEVCTGGLDVGFVSLGYAKSALLGVVQGITELLPISSTAHMRIVPALLGWPDPGAAFSASMQLAALVAVVSYFWTDVSRLTVNSTGALMRGRFRDRDLQLVIWIALATVPLGVAGIVLGPMLNACGSPLRSIPAIGIACIAMSLLLVGAELLASHRRRMADVKLLDALLVGVAQVGALIPGVSRSGSTLTAALGLGLRREDAARFSFLLGIPAIALAGLKELWELHKAHLSAHGWSVLGVGVGVGAISAFITIWGLMRFLERFNTWPFAIYRMILGVVLLAGWAEGWLS